MVLAVVVGVVIGGLTTLALRWRDARIAKRDARGRERLAAIVLYEEIAAAINAIDMALRDDSSRWLLSVSQSATLTEAWREQADALQELDADHWSVLNEAVSTLTRGHELIAPDPQPEDLRRSLVERRQLLASCADIVRTVRDRRTRTGWGRHARVGSLPV